MTRRLVIDLRSPRPVWRIPDWSVAAIREAAGAAWDVIDVPGPADSDGDGTGDACDDYDNLHPSYPFGTPPWSPEEPVTEETDGDADGCGCKVGGRAETGGTTGGAAALLGLLVGAAVMVRRRK